MIGIGIGISPTIGGATIAPPTPSSVSGLLFWFPPENIGHSGGNVTGLTDASANGNNPTLTGTPTYLTSELDGSAAISFGGSQRFNLPNVFTGLTEGEIFWVLKGNASGNGLHNLELDAAGQSLYPFSGDGHIYEGFGNGTRPDTGVPIVNLTSAYRLYNARISTGKVLSTFLNNSQQFSGSVTNVGFGTHPAIGASGGAVFDTLWIGKLVDVFMYDHVLSAADRTNKVIAYIHRKYPSLGV